MCTSFIKKTESNVYIGMNFDINGMKYKVHKRRKDWFLIYVEVANRKGLSFGVHKSGIFFNNLCVTFAEKGEYRRGKGVMHNARLLEEIVSGKIDLDCLKDLLNQTEIVNVPGWSTHNMICTREGNVFIVEPGRGSSYRELHKGDYQLMTNVPLLEEGINCRKECERFRQADDALKKDEVFNVETAFEILKETAQTKGEWITELSMVFDRNAGIVYYTEHQEFDHIIEYTI